MNALALSAIIFVLTLGGIFLGMLLRRTLPEHYLDEHAKDVVRLGVGLIATIVDLILLDNILAQHGSEAHLPREQMRGMMRGVGADRRSAQGAANSNRLRRANGQYHLW